MTGMTELPVREEAGGMSRALGVPRAALAAGSLARDQALRLLPTLIEPLAPDPAARAARLQQERARLPGQALQPVP